MRQPGTGVGGFSTMLIGEDGRRRPVTARGLIAGAAGIGLGLLAACTPVEPVWDRFFAVNVPPLGRSSIAHARRRDDEMGAD